MVTHPAILNELSSLDLINAKRASYDNIYLLGNFNSHIDLDSTNLVKETNELNC